MTDLKAAEIENLDMNATRLMVESLNTLLEQQTAEIRRLQTQVRELLEERDCYWGGQAENKTLTAERDAYREGLTKLVNWVIHTPGLQERLSLPMQAANKVLDKYGCADCHGKTFDDGMICCWTCGREMPSAGGEG